MIGPVFNWYFRQRYEAILRDAKQAVKMQRELLEDLVDAGKGTTYGQQYNFKSVGSYEDYRRLVPTVEYEDLKPWIERIMQGEQQLLWPGEITWFAKSSGTTGNTAKFIPISYECLEETHYKGGRDILSIYIGQNPDSQIFEGKGLLIGGSHKVNQLNTRSFYGDLSAVLMNHLPTWANLKSTPDMDIALMENWEEKLEHMAQATMLENVTSMSGVPTWAIIICKRILELTGKKHMHEVWPNMEVFFHGGVNFAPYREQFDAFFPDRKMKFLESYNASEGFFGIQSEMGDSAMLLMTQQGIFYEFYPVGEDDSNCVPLWEVKPGVNYAMVITTNCGLWRYKIGDTVEFSSLHPFKFRITGRTKLFINAFGEELVIENAETAVSAACKATGALVHEFTAAPVYMDAKEPGHEWLIEFDTEPDNLEHFTDVLDRELKNCNGDYAAKRHGDIAMKRPRIHNMPKGSFYNWLKQKGKLGGQNKVPRLCNDRRVLEDVLATEAAHRSTS